MKTTEEIIKNVILDIEDHIEDYAERPGDSNHPYREGLIHGCKVCILKLQRALVDNDKHQ
jgi:hypothetical protein